MKRAAVLVALLLTAAAPAPDTEDYLLMAPFADTIQRFYVNAIHCCSWADGRPVFARRCVVDEACPGGWEIRWKCDNDLGLKCDRWMPVPAEAVGREANPMGFAMAWWMSGVIRCFWPSNET
jgi:hypothetical protein